MRRGRLIALVAAAAALVGSLLFPLGTFNPPSSTSGIYSTTFASYAVDASALIASAAAHAPAGFAQGSSHRLNPSEAGLESGAYAVFSAQAGSGANMTIIVFDTPKSAQTYIMSVVSSAKGLSGYSDVSSSLSSYQHYGICYGFGEADPYGNGAVATGVCTKGNVYIQVHVVSPSSLSSAEGDMSILVGAAYQGVS